MDYFAERYNKTHKEKSKFSKWWDKNGYKVMRIILFPIWIVVWLKEKYNNKKIKNCKWSEKRAKEFCDKYLPIFCSKTDEGFYFYNNGYGFSSKRLKHKDRLFASCYKYKILDYIVKNYAIDGYMKENLSDMVYGNYEVNFIKKPLDK